MTKHAATGDPHDPGPGHETYYHRQERPGVVAIERTAPRWAFDLGQGRYHHSLELVALITGARLSPPDGQAGEMVEIARLVCEELNRRSAAGLTLGKIEDKPGAEPKS